MPQTLLGILALAILTQLTFSQQQVTIRSYEHQLRNEFSVAASGMLMQAMELMAARPFDAESSPQRIVGAGGLPEDDDFGTLGPGGGDTGCDLFSIDLDTCNDLDDLAEDIWRTADVELSNGYSLPFEVKVEVAYVDAANLDVVVSGPTTTKRVVLMARTPLLPYDSAFVHLERVIAYAPTKATEDCTRFHEEKGTMALGDIVAVCSSPR